MSVRTATRILLLASMLAVLLWPMTAGAAQTVPTTETISPRQAEPVSGEYVAFFRDGLSERERDRLVRDYGGRIRREIPAINAAMVKIRSDRAPQLALDPAIVYLEPNLRRYTTGTSNDPDLGLQWGLNQINAFDAWDVTTGSSDVIVAILDTGVYYRHQDLDGVLLDGYDVVRGRSGQDDSEGHGSHVAGIVNAETNNAEGIAGVSWGSRLLPIRVVDRGRATSAHIAEGIVFAADQGAKVINISLSGFGWTKVERDAINYAYSKEAIVVASAGDAGTSTWYYPASYDNVISVGGSDQVDGLMAMSNFGTSLDLVAPGVDIYSTVRRGEYEYMSGTSQAAPHVAGVAALVWSAGHTPWAFQVVQALLCSAADLGAAGRDDTFGWGLVQADAAVDYNPMVETTCLASVSNDRLTSAQYVNPYPTPYSDARDVSNATSTFEDPTPCSGQGAKSVWYYIPAPTHGILTVDVSGSNYGAVAGLYRGYDNGLEEIACGVGGFETSLVGDWDYYVGVFGPDSEGTNWDMAIDIAFVPHPVGGCITNGDTVFCQQF